MRKIFSVDRIEEDVAVCISDDDEQIDVPLSHIKPLGLHDVFSATVENGELKDMIPMPDEKKKRLSSNKERLKRLVERSKNK